MCCAVGTVRAVAEFKSLSVLTVVIAGDLGDSSSLALDAMAEPWLVEGAGVWLCCANSRPSH